MIKRSAKCPVCGGEGFSTHFDVMRTMVICTHAILKAIREAAK